MSLAAWLRLTLIPGIGGETQRKLLATFGLPEAIFAAGRLELARQDCAGVEHQQPGVFQAGEPAVV